MKIVVTGGGGFLGRHIVDQLLARDYEVASMTRSAQPELAARGVEVIRGDITDVEDVHRAVDDADAVIHTAAMVGAWGDVDTFWRVNVDGTNNLLRVAARAGVERFVFTSSPSVVFDGSDLIQAPQNTPYPKRFPSPYAETKAVSEQLVLDADDPEGMRTVALRPQLMWGPGDPHLVPMIVHKARNGRLRVVGDGEARVDITYIDNAAHAHLCALDALAETDARGRVRGAGRAYFITNGEPVVLWRWIEDLLEHLEEPPPRGSVPRPLAAMAGRAVSSVWRTLGLRHEPPLTEYVALKMSTHQTYDLSPARRDLGYAPKVSMAQGFERFIAHEVGAEPTSG